MLKLFVRLICLKLFGRLNWYRPTRKPRCNLKVLEFWFHVILFYKNIVSSYNLQSNLDQEIHPYWYYWMEKQLCKQQVYTSGKLLYSFQSTRITPIMLLVLPQFLRRQRGTSFADSPAEKKVWPRCSLKLRGTERSTLYQTSWPKKNGRSYKVQILKQCDVYCWSGVQLVLLLYWECSTTQRPDIVKSTLGWVEFVISPWQHKVCQWYLSPHHCIVWHMILWGKSNIMITKFECGHIAYREVHIMMIDEFGVCPHFL